MQPFSKILGCRVRVCFLSFSALNLLYGFSMFTCIYRGPKYCGLARSRKAVSSYLVRKPKKIRCPPHNRCPRATIIARAVWKPYQEPHERDKIEDIEGYSYNSEEFFILGNLYWTNLRYFKINKVSCVR